MFENALWAVSFSSSVGGAGTGVITFQGNKLFGGDSGYYYQGTYSIDAAGNMTATAKVTQYNPGMTSIFGPLTEFSLALAGHAQGGNVKVTGSIIGQPGAKINIAMRKLSDL